MFEEYSKSRSRAVRNEIVEAYLPLARMLASRFRLVPSPSMISYRSRVSA
jgi:DNA-directed RNA polymerase specialized sigma subunit